MFVNQKDMKVEIKEHMRDGNGNVKIQKILSDDLPKKCKMFAHMTLNKGCSIGYHTHEKETEIFYILKGKAKVNDNGTIKIAEPGDAVATGNGSGHSIENECDTPLEFVATIIYD